MVWWFNMQFLSARDGEREWPWTGLATPDSYARPSSNHPAAASAIYADGHGEFLSGRWITRAPRHDDFEPESGGGRYSHRQSPATNAQATGATTPFRVGFVARVSRPVALSCGRLLVVALPFWLCIFVRLLAAGKAIPSAAGWPALHHLPLRSTGLPARGFVARVSRPVVLPRSTGLQARVLARVSRPVALSCWPAIGGAALPFWLCIFARLPAARRALPSAAGWPALHHPTPS